MSQSPGARPNVIVLGGPNGAGKTTVSRAVLADELDIAEFVNADVIAQGLSGFDPDRAAFAAGRIMLTRLRELAGERRSFAFETTLASQSFAPFIRKLQDDGYRFHLLYVWLRSPEMCVNRVRARVRRGGHDVPEETIRRRYGRSAANLHSLYLPMADAWAMYNNSFGGEAELVADGRRGESPRIVRVDDWEHIRRIAHEQEGNQY